MKWLDSVLFGPLGRKADSFFGNSEVSIQSRKKLKSSSRSTTTRPISFQTFPIISFFQMSSFSSNPAVLERIRELREAEARKKETEALKEQQHLDTLRQTVEIASIEWEAEMIFAVESSPGLLEMLRTPHRPPPSHWGASFDYTLVMNDTLNVRTVLTAIHFGLNESGVPGTFTLLHERARCRLRVLKRVYEQFQSILQEERRLEAERLEAERLAREAHKKAEQEALTEILRIKINERVMHRLESHPKFNTLSHNFIDSKGSPSTLYVAYTEHRASHERVLQVLRATHTSIEEGLTDISSGDFSSPGARPPRPLQIPAEWATHYEEGKIPFLPVCPTCGKPPSIHKWAGSTPDRVECIEHYKWEVATDKHFKWEAYPPPVAPTGWNHHLPNPALLVNYNYRTVTGRWVVWDPKDPDGAIAAKALQDKKLMEAEAELARLQARISELKRT